MVDKKQPTILYRAVLYVSKCTQYINTELYSVCIEHRERKAEGHRGLCLLFYLCVSAGKKGAKQ